MSASEQEQRESREIRLMAERRKEIIFFIQKDPCFYFCFNLPAAQQRRNTASSATTTVGPMAVAAISEAAMPMTAQIREIASAHTVTLLKVLKRRMAERAGKMISAEDSSVSIHTMDLLHQNEPHISQAISWSTEETSLRTHMLHHLGSTHREPSQYQLR